MDIATIVGFIAAITFLMVGIGPNLESVVDPVPLIIVVGGTIATALIANPLQAVVNLVGIYARTFFVRSLVPTELVERIVGFAETARREGILALEKALKPEDDPFLAGGVRLAVDGTEPDLIMDILETEVQFIKERHSRAQRNVGFLGLSGLVFGGIGGALAVVLAAPDATGLTVASSAALPLCYGLFLFGVFSEPIRRKLDAYGELETLTKRIVIEGIMSIQSGDNPRIVEHKLCVFLAPRFRPSGEKPVVPTPRTVAGPPPVDEPFVAEVGRYGVEQEERFVHVVRAAVERSDAEPEEAARVEELLERVAHKELPTMTMLARLSDQLRGEVIQALAKPSPPPLVQQMAESAVFIFEDLRHLTDREIQVLLREVDQRDLVVALKGTSPELRDKILGNMSERVRTFIEEEMSLLGALGAGKVFAVQSRIVAQVMQLVEQGQITLSKDDQG